MAEPWVGKHMWIWELDQCAGGNEGAIIAKAKDLGLAGLLVKAWDGGSYWSQFEQIAGPAGDAGLVMGAWGYSYGNNISGEVSAMERAAAAGAGWLIIDAESEYESGAGRNNATSLFNALSSSLAGGATVGYSSFAFTDLHSSFPYDVFSSHCAVALPQVYWGEFRMSPDKALDETLQAYQQYSLPVAPVGQSYGSVTPDEISLFGQTAINLGVTGISCWSWQHATDAMMSAIKAIPYEGGQPGMGVSDWAKEAWDKAVAKGVLDGTDPQGAVTREMLAAVLDRLGLLEPAVQNSGALQDLANKAKFSSPHVGKEQVDLNLLAIILKQLGII